MPFAVEAGAEANAAFGRRPYVVVTLSLPLGGRCRACEADEAFIAYYRKASSVLPLRGNPPSPKGKAQNTANIPCAQNHNCAKVLLVLFSQEKDDLNTLLTFKTTLNSLLTLKATLNSLLTLKLDLKKKG